MKLIRGLLCVVFLFVSSSAARAQTPVPLTASGNQATGSFTLPGGIGADLTISFEQVVGLNPAALQATVGVVNPLDAGLRARLADGVTVPDAFPVLVSIEPVPSRGLSFAGVSVVSLHTHNLNLDSSAPFTLFSASGVGAFRDVTRFVGIGSYRAEASVGGFSQFLIVADQRPIDTVIGGKFDLLEGSLNDLGGSVPAALLSDLLAMVSQARLLWQLGATLPAIIGVTTLIDTLKAQDAMVIPNVWRFACDPANVAGAWRSAAETLRFSLRVNASRSPPFPLGQ
jgi:hypothetical protein